MIHRSARLAAPFQMNYRQILLTITTIVMAGLFSGCATTGSNSGDQAYEYESSERYVKLEPAEASATANEHPYSISAQTLKPWFANLKATGSVTLSEEILVFTEEELNFVVDHLASALAKVRPDQDITFQSAGSRGFFGKYTAPSFTSGRLFVQNGELNLIFGVMHSRPELDTSGITDLPYPTGSRLKRIEQDWQVKPGTGELVNGRGDWVSFALTGTADTGMPQQSVDMATPEPSPATNEPPKSAVQDSAVEQRSQQIESKLRVLDDLKDKKLITEEEYGEQRKAILQGI